MSQNATALPTTGTLSGLSLVAKVNEALDTIASHESGAADPGAIGAYRSWADTLNGVMKQRNAGNSGWLVRGSLAEAFLVAKSANFAVALADFGKIFPCTSTITASFAAAAALGDGFWCGVRNDGTGALTLDPNGSELIDGAATAVLAPGECCYIWCDGSAFKTVGRQSLGLQTQKATAFTTAGTAPAFTLTPVPAIVALAAGQRFRAKFNADGTTGSNTMNVSGLGAQSLKQYSYAGAKTSGIVKNNMLADIEYDGTDFVILTPLPPNVSSVGHHEVTVHTGNGRGTSATKIRRYSTALVNIGTAITYADNSSNGASFTINEDGVYAMTTTDRSTGGSGVIGISRNSAALTTSIDGIPVATRVIQSQLSSNAHYTTGRTMFLSAGDVIRSHDDGSCDLTDDRVMFTITKVGT